MVVLGCDLLTRLTREVPSAHTAVALWVAVAKHSSWQGHADVMASFPAAVFVAPTLATFNLINVGCTLTVQIAFNSGVVIVLAANSFENTVGNGL
ncbi:type II toxin-antitoxin system HigB family toxin [Variovorax sp. OK605]|uniref:type II toxin-antitoxin system HigB family toxin n=1 Tax=Variovorax sp. OK605 TaxID=1855317 RepID=UPI000B82EF27